MKLAIYRLYSYVKCISGVRLQDTSGGPLFQEFSSGVPRTALPERFAFQEFLQLHKMAVLIRHTREFLCANVRREVMRL
jgi:hypothetical protein